jgi:hypothetical protein
MTFQEGKLCLSDASLFVFNLMDTSHYFNMPLLNFSHFSERFCFYIHILDYNLEGVLQFQTFLTFMLW